jgi:hypothetical protein
MFCIADSLLKLASTEEEIVDRGTKNVARLADVIGRGSETLLARLGKAPSHRMTPKAKDLMLGNGRRCRWMIARP